MPTKQITVCASCGKKTCDGALWKWVRMRHIKTGKVVGLARVPIENQTGCTLSYGVRNRKALTGRDVGDQVELRFTNWVIPTDLTVEKIEA